jgi:hypothetical protein
MREKEDSQEDVAEFHTEGVVLWGFWLVSILVCFSSAFDELKRFYFRIFIKAKIFLIKSK